MGYDVTFHPVSAADLQRFVFDVVDKPALAEARAAEITRDKRKQREIVDVMGHLPKFAAEAAKDKKGEAFGNTIAFAAAAVAGYIHPFWYARGSALTFLLVTKVAKPKEVPFTPLPALARGKVAKLKDGSAGYLTENYTASGFLAPERVAEVEALLARLEVSKKAKKPGPIFEAFDEQGLDSLRRALKYAREKGLGLLEATDAMVPMSDEATTDLDNARAHFLGNVAHDKPGAVPKKKASKKKASKKKAAPKKKATTKR